MSQHENSVFVPGDFVSVFLGRKKIASGVVFEVIENSPSSQQPGRTYLVRSKAGQLLGPFFGKALRPQSALERESEFKADSTVSRELRQRAQRSNGDGGGGVDNAETARSLGQVSTSRPRITQRERQSHRSAAASAAAAASQRRIAQAGFRGRTSGLHRHPHVPIDIAEALYPSPGRPALLAPQSQKAVTSLTASELRTELRALLEPSFGRDVENLRQRLAEAILLRQQNLRKDHASGYLRPTTPQMSTGHNPGQVHQSSTESSERSDWLARDNPALRVAERTHGCRGGGAIAAVSQHRQSNEVGNSAQGARSALSNSAGGVSTDSERSVTERKVMLRRQLRQQRQGQAKPWHGTPQGHFNESAEPRNEFVDNNISIEEQEILVGAYRNRSGQQSQVHSTKESSEPVHRDGPRRARYLVSSRTSRVSTQRSRTIQSRAHRRRVVPIAGRTELRELPKKSVMLEFDFSKGADRFQVKETVKDLAKKPLVKKKNAPPARKVEGADILLTSLAVGQGSTRASSDDALKRVLLGHGVVFTVLEFLECTDIPALWALGKVWYDKLAGGKEAVWHVMCEQLARQYGMYVPRSYDLGFEHLFWHHLWPNRKKWATNLADGDDPYAADFKIAVYARCKPLMREQSSVRQMVIPLHQKMRLIRKGKLEAQKLFDIPEAGSSEASSQVDALIAASGGNLSPELIQALVEAQRLQHDAAAALMDDERRKRKQASAWVANSANGHSTTLGMAQHHSHAAMDHIRAERAIAPAAVPAAGSLASLLASRGSGTSSAHTSAESTANGSADGGEDDNDQRRAASRAQFVGTQPTQVVMYMPGAGVRPFTFPRVFGVDVDQRGIFDGLGREVVMGAMSGFNACLITYGQTGSGKTHTIFGPDGVLQRQRAELASAYARLRSKSGLGAVTSEAGMAIRIAHELLMAQQSIARQGGISMTLSVQYVELYQSDLSDLTTGKPVRLRDTGSDPFRFLLQGSAEHQVKSLEGFLAVLQQGEVRKQFAETAMNGRSSRAHTFLVFTIRQTNPRTGVCVTSTLHLVDLAGSEQLKQSRAEGQRKKEAIEINSSLMVLGRCISALVEGKSHVPYYESKLTLLLKDAIGGSSRTHVVVTCSLDEEHGNQTLDTLRFGERCSNITNRATMNAMSLDDAISTIDDALQQCQVAMEKQRAQGREHLPVFQKMRQRFNQLVQQRRLLAKDAGGGVKDGDNEEEAD